MKDQQKTGKWFMLKCYIINLDRAKDRWEETSNKFLSVGMNVIRVPAIDGKELSPPYPDFAPWRYFFYYGRMAVPNVIACYLSHIKALQIFLETDAKHAIICEDDVSPQPELGKVIEDAMQYSDHWDLLRLCCFKPTRGIHFAELSHGYRLCCDLKTASGNCAKIVNRSAAETIIKKLLPIKLAHDVALFYDWPIGIREVTVLPFPILLNEQLNQNSTIGGDPKFPTLHPAMLRHFISLPYRICSRTTRKISRIRWAMQCRYWPPKPHRTDTDSGKR
jgi:glycosyl transferase family 25